MSVYVHWTKADKRQSVAKTANLDGSSDTSEGQASSGESQSEEGLFELWDSVPFIPDDHSVPIDSLESAVGYSSLLRQFHQAFLRRVAFYKTQGGGSLSAADARKAAFHSCTSSEDAKQRFETLMQLPLERLNFVDLYSLYECAPRVAERFWERVKREAAKEFASGHLAANITFPEGYMKEVWNIARYLGVRETFVQEWKPKGGLELSMVEMLAQCWFQWQYWLEQTVKRSGSDPRADATDRSAFSVHDLPREPSKARFERLLTRLSAADERTLDRAVEMAERFHRMFMRTLRQLRDLRRYNPVTINNPQQVNIAADGGNQVNVSRGTESDR